MKRRCTLLVLASALALVATGCAGGGETSSAGIEADEVRSRVSLASTGFGAVYMDLTNSGDVADVLVSASVDEDIAGTVELHETVTLDDGSAPESEMGESEMGESEMETDGEMSGMSGMEMREVEGIDVPAGETVSLSPGGLHVMLIDLASDLEDGDEFDVTLEFEEAGSMTITSTVSTNP